MMKNNMVNNNMMNNNMMNNNKMNDQKKFTNVNPDNNLNSTVEFLYINQMKGQTAPIKVQSNNAMTVEQLIKNFRVKLMDNSIIINQYILNDNIQLNPNSMEPISNYGINDSSVIKAIA